MKYLCFSPDGSTWTTNEITFELEDLVSDGEIMVFKFEDNNYYQYLGTDDGWEIVGYDELKGGV